jgi:mRNA-degrading endonuclease toxin of MazEF toxin-antitoxin module
MAKKRLDLKALVQSVTDQKVFPGAVYICRDPALRFPETDEDKRTMHDGRRVILLQAGKYNMQGLPPGTALVVPCSASHTGQVGPFDMEIPEGTSGFTKRAVAYTSLVQPVRKSDLSDYCGNVPVPILKGLRSRVYDLFDLSHLAPLTPG